MDCWWFGGKLFQQLPMHWTANRRLFLNLQIYSRDHILWAKWFILLAAKPREVCTYQNYPKGKTRFYISYFTHWLFAFVFRLTELIWWYLARREVKTATTRVDAEATGQPSTALKWFWFGPGAVSPRLRVEWFRFVHPSNELVDWTRLQVWHLMEDYFLAAWER